MKKEEWTQLEMLNEKDIRAMLSTKERLALTVLFHMTEKEADHPEEWEWPCLCYECRSSE